MPRALLGACALLLTLSACNDYPNYPHTTSVPNVVGQAQAAASTAIADAGLTVGTVTQAASATVVSGDVVSETPAAGTRVASGSAVSLVISTGPALVSVPNVVGDTQAAAATAITAAGLTVGNVTQASSATVASGLVISETPAAGTSVAAGSSVALVVSTGAATVAVPNVVGDTVATATTALTGAGLILGTQTNASSPTVASGDIISQNPAAGQSAAPGSAVNVVVSSGAASPTFTVLHTFGASPDGANPFGLIQGSDGYFYVTAHGGGANTLGAIIQIKPDGTETVLHSFAGLPSDGAAPIAAVVESSPGVFYGTTEFGGPANVGTVFQVTSASAYTSIYAFLGSPSGSDPRSPLIQVGGDFYGTTYSGGTGHSGIVFQLNPVGPVETDLHSFAGVNDGAHASVMIKGADGNFYGGTVLGGPSNCGTIFEINTTTSAETITYSFMGSPDGYSPVALVEDGQGNFYGVTQNGGLTTNSGPGTAFKISSLGTESVLHDFAYSTGDTSQPAPGSDGSVPSTLILGMDGNLYGTTTVGGTYGAGTIFMIALPSGTETVLYSLNGAGDGSAPRDLVQGSDGNLYGVASNSGSGFNGTLFRLNLP